MATILEREPAAPRAPAFPDPSWRGWAFLGAAGTTGQQWAETGPGDLPRPEQCVSPPVARSSPGVQWGSLPAIFLTSQPSPLLLRYLKTIEK